MSEKRFLSFIFLEGIILTILGLCILIIPKLTELSFGIMLSSAFISYGIYKIIHSLVNKNFARNFLMELFLGAFILTLGILLLLVPRISLLWLIALIGVYFILDSLSTSAFISQIRNMYNFWGCKLVCAVIMAIIGIFIVIGLPAMSFWLVAMLCGMGFLVKGMSKIALYNANKYNV